MGNASNKLAEDVMSTPIETISASATVRETAAKMRDDGINSLLVPGSEMGIVTSTDVLDATADGHIRRSVWSRTR